MGVFLFLIFLQYVILEGFREGYYWHYKNKSNDNSKFDIHPFFSWQRGLFFLTMVCIMASNIKEVIDIGKMILGMLLMFSFLHNGSYYVTRNKLDENIYSKGFLDQSTTSTAIWTKFMTPISRTTLFVIGLVIYFI
jgi:hypothetical protein